jgi:hypothetical protein
MHELVANGDFSSMLDDWMMENNPVNDEDTDALWENVNGVCENEPSSGPSARVIYQDVDVPSVVQDVVVSFSFAQEPTEDLDPDDVLVIEKDPYDNSMMGGKQNAFRIDVISPDEDVFYATILTSIYAPTTQVGAIDDLEVVTPDTTELLALLQQEQGETLRLRIAQVESTFPWALQLDDVSVVVTGAY